jgi:hypothetical protein
MSLSFSTISLDSYHSMTEWMNGGEYVDRWRQSLINGRLYKDFGAGNSNLNVPALSWYPDPALDIQKLTGLTADPTAMRSVLMGYDWVDYIGGTVKMRPTTAAEQALGWPAQVPVYNSNNIRSYDWMDAATRQGLTQSHQISLTSGTETSHMAMSINYYNQKGVQKDQNYKRYSLNLSGDITPVKWFTLGTSVIGTFSLQNYGILPPNTSNTGSKDLYSRATDQFPYALPNDSSGAAIKNPGGNISLWNPIIDITQALNERRSAAVLATMFTEIKFTPWLKHRLNFGVQYREMRSSAWTGPDATSHLTNRPNTAGYATSDNFSWVVENLFMPIKLLAKIIGLA